MRFEVVPDELASASAVLSGLAESLATLLELGGRLEAAIPAVGPTRMVAATGRANTAWLRVVEQVMDDLVVLSGRAAGAGHAYRSTDDMAVGR